MSFKQFNLIFFMLILVIFYGCGGGGSDSSTVTTKGLASISLSSTSLTLSTNGTFDLSTVTVIANYTDSTTENVTGVWSTVSGSITGNIYTAPSTGVSDTLTCTYNGKTSAITVSLQTLSSISLSTSTASVATSATIDLSTMIITSTYSDSTTGTITTGASWSCVSGTIVSTSYTAPSTAGNDTITCTYQGKTANITVLILDANASTTEIIIPEIETAGSGVQSTPTATGEVYYYNEPDNKKSESDIQMVDTIKREQVAKKYFLVSGTATPNDSGYTDRGYHSVLFKVKHEDYNESLGAANSVNFDNFTIPVNDQNAFSGYLYFRKTGKYTIYAFRSRNDHLYPKISSAPDNTVSEGYSTLAFYVHVTEKVPDDKVHLIPTLNVDNGTKSIRDYAQILTANKTTDTDKIKAIYEFLVFGDAKGAFIYSEYDKISTYLPEVSNNIFVASHFLEIRKGVCNDYAELFAALTRSLGYKVKRVSGDDPSDNQGHMWNIIYANGNWLKIDATHGNNVPKDYKKYAEFYTEFNETDFDTGHDQKYSVDLKSEY